MDGIASHQIATALFDETDAKAIMRAECDDVIRNAGGDVFEMPGMPFFDVIAGESSLQRDWYTKVAASGPEPNAELTGHEIFDRGAQYEKMAKSMQLKLNKWVSRAQKAEKRASEIEAHIRAP